MQLGTALNLPNPRINFGGTGKVPGKGSTAIFSFETGVLDSRINFSRTTNATVTNSAGVITYAPHNLLTYSEQFDNAAWGKGKATVTANSINSPNNTITADSIVEDTSTGVHRLLFSSTLIIGNSYTLSAYFKKANRNIILYLSDGVEAKGYAFNLTNGTTYPPTGFSLATPNITPVGDGWYRCSITMVAAGTSASVQFRLDNGDGSGIYTGDGSVSLYAWGAQLEIGSTATTYNSTTVKNLLGYSELFDNAAWTKSNSFVQTNLLTYSEAFDNAAWTKAGVTINANQDNAINGYQTADRIIESNLSERHRAFSTSITALAGNVTFSCYMKAGARNFGFLTGLTDGGSNQYSIVVNLTTATVTSTGTSGSPIFVSSFATLLNDGWVRVILTLTNTSGTVSTQIGLSDVAVPTYNGAIPTYAGDGTSYISIWGAQLVQGSVAGDYRRTDAAALPVYYPNHNGVVCAEKIVSTTATGFHNFVQNPTVVANSPYTISVYLKQSEYRYGFIYSDGAAKGVIFDLQTGVVTANIINAPTQSSITSVGNGWYRCSITTSSSTTTSSAWIGATNSSTSANIAGDGTSGIYIFGAQLSDSASLDPYVLNAAAAPTAAAYYGARFDYDPVTLAPKGLLIEEQRANLLLNSGGIGGTSWSKGTSTVVLNAGTAPDGSNSASLITTFNNNVLQVVSATAGVTYAITFYAKPDGSTLGISSETGVAVAKNFVLTYATGIVTGTADNKSATLLANGWWKCSYTVTAATTTSLVFYLYGGSGFSEAGTSYLWGAQLEAGAFATSYIPTAASQVTRAADVATIQGSNFYSWYNQNEGSLYSNASSFNTASSVYPTVFSLRLANLSNNGMNLLYLNSNTLLEFSVTLAAVTQAAITATGSSKPTLSKMAGTYKVNDFQFAVNNTLGTADTSGTTPIIEEMTLGRLYNNSNANYWNGHIKQISYYPQRLSSDVLKGLTA